MIKPDQHFLNAMMCSSCFGQDFCRTVPCACAQSIMDIVVRKVMERLHDHYWDSLEPHRELILKHVRGAIGNTEQSKNEDEAIPIGTQR
jgi:hypothetical protein